MLPVRGEFYDGGDQSYQVKCDTLIINRFPLSLEIFSLFSELKRIRGLLLFPKKKNTTYQRNLSKKETTILKKVKIINTFLFTGAIYIMNLHRS